MAAELSLCFLAIFPCLSFDVPYTDCFPSSLTELKWYILLSNSFFSFVLVNDNYYHWYIYLVNSNFSLTLIISISLYVLVLISNLKITGGRKINLPLLKNFQLS